MSINKAIANVLAGKEAKLIHGQCVGQMNPYVEWLKWLSYESEYEKQLMNLVASKTSLEFSYDELQKVCRIKRNRVFADLFKRYGTSGCSEEEYMMVYDYMCKESIEELMVSKLSSAELRSAKEKIIYFSRMKKEQLREKIHKEQDAEVYEKLSMEDSYLLHIISNFNFVRTIGKLNKEIDAQISKNNAMAQKSLYYAYNPHFKR